MASSSFADLLADLSELINKYGPQSRQVKNFIKKNKSAGPEFRELAELSCDLKQALCPNETYPQGD